MTVDRTTAADDAVRAELDILATAAWTPEDGSLDVAVIGAGMCGIAAAGALAQRGVRRVRLFDRSAAGAEGPWTTFARMETLRSPKTLPGPCLGAPSLSFPAWKRARDGEAAWRALYKIPNAEWQAYLDWLRGVLTLDVRNDCAVTAIEPDADGVTLRLQGRGGREGREGASVARARHVVIATGRPGVGGAFVPPGVAPDLWPDLAAHSAEPIDFARLRGARVAVVGGGASAWDNAATALEQGAGSVVMLIRRPTLPQVNYGRATAHAGWMHGWRDLPDAEKWRLGLWLRARDAPPPHETVHRAMRAGKLDVRLGAALRGARREGGGVAVSIDGADAAQRFDFLICGTGFALDLGRQPELAAVAPHVALWRDRRPPADAAHPLARFPYLGPGFEAAPRGPDAPPGLDRLRFFNHAAYLSHGPLASDIPGINVGAARLADSLAAALFLETYADQRAAMEAFAEPELESTPFFALDRASAAE